MKIFRKHIDNLKGLCSDSEEELETEDKLWFLNITFAEYYMHGKNHKIKRNSLDEIRQFSFQLAQLGIIRDAFKKYKLRK